MVTKSRTKTPDKRHLTNGKPKTAGYQPLDTRWFHRPRDLPPMTWLTIEAMLMEPTIRLGVAMRAAPLMNCEFAYKPRGEKEYKTGIQASTPIVAEFVHRQLKRIWRDLDALLIAQQWGWAAAEVVYHLTDHQHVEVNRLLARHPKDCRCLVRNGDLCGVRFSRLKHTKSGMVDLEFPKAIFHRHNPQSGRYYGETIFEGAYSPWWDKWGGGGALGSRRLTMQQSAIDGRKLYYPDGTTEVPINGVDTEVPNRDIARMIVEQIMSGGVSTLPNTRDANGNRMWELEEAKAMQGLEHLLRYPKDLDVEILRGMEIPDEVGITEVTGAWEGKKVPMMAFYGGLDKWLGSIVRDVKLQIMDHLVALNFGRQWYEIETKPLAEQAMEQAKANEPKQAPPMPGGFGRDGDSDGMAGEGRPPGPLPQRMSLDPVQLVGESVLSAAQLVQAAREVIDRRLIRMEATPQGLHWITIGGREVGEKKHVGGFPVQIDRNGTIVKSGGPKGLVGKHVSKAGEHFTEERSKRFYEREAELAITPRMSWGKIVERQTKRWGIDADTYESVAADVWSDRQDIAREREAAKTYARQRLKLSQADINRLENQGFDYGSEHKRVKGLDTFGRELAGMYPSLAWGGGYDSDDDGDQNYDEKVWNLIREGKQTIPSRTSKEYHAEVDEQLEALAKAKQRKKPEKEEDDFSFGANRFSLEPHSYSSTQFNLPGDLADAVRGLALAIPDDDLAEDGREMDPHITIKYGLHTNDAEEVRRAVGDMPPVAIRLGPVSVFATSDTTSQRGGAQHDVVKIEVESKGLHALNARICEALQCTNKFPDYKPHITIAYVKPGLGEKYAAILNDLQGRVAVFDRLVFSDKERKHTSIPLLGTVTRFSADFEAKHPREDDGTFSTLEHMAYPPKPDWPQRDQTTYRAVHAAFDKLGPTLEPAIDRDRIDRLVKQQNRVYGAQGESETGGGWTMDQETAYEFTGAVGKNALRKPLRAAARAALKAARMDPELLERYDLDEHLEDYVDYIASQAVLKSFAGKQRMATDAEGHEHKPAGTPEGGQFMSAGQAAKAGKSHGQWTDHAGRAFANEEIGEDHPAWKAVQHGTAPTVDEYNSAKSLYQQFVRTSLGHFGQLTDVADDAKSVTVTHPTGETSKHHAEGLHHLGAWMEHRYGKGHSNEKALAYIAPILAKEYLEAGVNISVTMRKHGLDPIKNQEARKAIAEEADKIRAATEKLKNEPSPARKAAQEKQRKRESDA